MSPVVREVPPRHRCRAPYGRDGSSLSPSLHPGGLWRCPECGKLWQAYAAGWDLPSWLTRWRYRKAAR